MTRMRTDDEALALIRLHGKALTGHLDSHCVAIVGFENGYPKEVGSGTCVTVGGRYFIATAAHVISPYSDDDLFIVHTRTPSAVHTPILGRGSRGGDPADPEDVAWLELAESDALALGKNFVLGGRLRGFISDLPDDNALVYGYPAEKIDPDLLAWQRLRLEPIGHTTPTIPAASLGFSLKYDLCLEYPVLGNILSTGEPVKEMPAAPGLSGGGVWATGLREPGVWAPEKCRLIAIEHSWRRGQYLRCTQIQHWLRLLAANKPELRSEIEAILDA